jgi:YD repeat-containing protein
MPNGALTDYNYDGQNRVLNITQTANSTTLGSYAYQYDRSGNTKQSIVALNGGAAVTTTWDYDNAHRLVSETLGGIVTTFAYDDAGNRVTEVNNGVTTTNTYNAMNQLLTSTKPTEVITHTYDARGNLKTQVSKTGATTNYTNTFTYNTRDLLTNAAMGAASAAYTKNTRPNIVPNIRPSCRIYIALQWNQHITTD